MDKYQKLIDGLETLNKRNKTKKSNYVGQLMLIDSSIEDKEQEIENNNNSLAELKKTLDTLINYKAIKRNKITRHVFSFGGIAIAINLVFEFFEFLDNKLFGHGIFSTNVKPIQFWSTTANFITGLASIILELTSLRKIKKENSIPEIETKINLLNIANETLSLELDRLYSGKERYETKAQELDESIKEIESTIRAVVESREIQLNVCQTTEQLNAEFKKDPNIITLIRVKKEKTNQEVKNG